MYGRSISTSSNFQTRTNWNDWTPWSPKTWYWVTLPSGAHVRVPGPYQARTRTGSVVTSWTQTTQWQDCRLVDQHFNPCPPDGWPPPGVPGSPCMHLTEMSRAPSVSQQSMTRPLYQREVRLFDPPDELFEWHAACAPPLLADDTMIVYTAWIEKLKNVRSAEVLLDHTVPYEHRKPIRATDLDVGWHRLDFIVNRSGETSRHQLAFSVDAGVDIAFDNEAPQVNLTKDVNGSKLNIVVTNRAGRDVTVRLRPLATPVGWMALFLKSPTFVVRAGRTTRIPFQVEVMSPLGIHRDRLQFIVGATVDYGAATRELAATMAVSIKTTRAVFGRAKAIQKELAREEAALFRRRKKADS